MGYTHVDIEICQSPKRASSPCGDVLHHRRTPADTALVLADGLGSGIKANLAAILCGERLLKLLEHGFTLRESFANLVQTMNDARTTDLPYAAFAVARILNNGQATALTYEMPPPILVGKRVAHVLNQRCLTVDEALIGEVHCQLENGEGLLLVSDGITQAGLGVGLRDGWLIEGVCAYVNDSLNDHLTGRSIPQLVHQRARQLWRDIAGDDCTASLASCRPGQAINLFTGPPADRNRDGDIVRQFIAAEGVKVVCGATTATLVGHHTGRKLQVEQTQESLIAPPRYFLQGVDLVTEGAVTLNQVYNILDADPSQFEPDTGVTRLCELLRGADRVNFLVGQAPNLGGGHISFRQQGILPRSTIIPLISEKLRATGKLVVVTWI